jgi:sarcosine oxidase delta subunit
MMSIKCRFCGALISGDFTKGDTFPARNIDNKTGKEVETFPICRDCYYETRGAEQEKEEHKGERPGA